jgi:acid phosphatase family membrane protein YuiD
MPDRLRELLGHTPFEVIVGAFLGMATAYVFHYKLTMG